MYVVAVNISPFGTLDDWKKYWRSKGGGNVIWAEDSQREMVALLEVYSLGTTIIIDRQGHISYRDSGPTPYDTLRTQIENIL